MSDLLNTLIEMRDECGPADGERHRQINTAIDDMRAGGVASLLGLPPLAATSATTVAA